MCRIIFVLRKNVFLLKNSYHLGLFLFSFSFLPVIFFYLFLLTICFKPVSDLKTKFYVRDPCFSETISSVVFHRKEMQSRKREKQQFSRKVWLIFEMIQFWFSSDRAIIRSNYYTRKGLEMNFQEKTDFTD